ncbi:hypothetical protein E2C01_067658 [Portunus trituberculatus]|uniref:Uncharacterized protein n=1 Tax=Portunus trituberculatus TaxID=210409 RepID=A0A5B7HU73_PORTR|nr:hypothetical protein [Portunus trituberculatus]
MHLKGLVPASVRCVSRSGVAVSERSCRAGRSCVIAVVCHAGLAGSRCWSPCGPGSGGEGVG